MQAPASTWRTTSARRHYTRLFCFDSTGKQSLYSSTAPTPSRSSMRPCQRPTAQLCKCWSRLAHDCPSTVRESPRLATLSISASVTASASSCVQLSIIQFVAANCLRVCNELFKLKLDALFIPEGCPRRTQTFWFRPLGVVLRLVYVGRNASSTCQPPRHPSRPTQSPRKRKGSTSLTCSFANGPNRTPPSSMRLGLYTQTQRLAPALDEPNLYACQSPNYKSIFIQQAKTLRPLLLQILKTDQPTVRPIQSAKAPAQNPPSCQPVCRSRYPLSVVRVQAPSESSTSPAS